jgi:hypothetical protein
VTKNSGTTGKRAARAAGKTLSNPSSTKAERTAAASDLTQTPSGGRARQTTPKAASAAGSVLADPKSSKTARSAAASDLSQAPRRGGKK